MLTSKAQKNRKSRKPCTAGSLPTCVQHQPRPAAAHRAEAILSQRLRMARLTADLFTRLKRTSTAESLSYATLLCQGYTQHSEDPLQEARAEETLDPLSKRERREQRLTSCYTRCTLSISKGSTSEMRRRQVIWTGVILVLVAGLLVACGEDEPAERVIFTPTQPTVTYDTPLTTQRTPTTISSEVPGDGAAPEEVEPSEPEVVVMQPVEPTTTTTTVPPTTVPPTTTTTPTTSVPPATTTPTTSVPPATTTPTTSVPPTTVPLKTGSAQEEERGDDSASGGGEEGGLKVVVEEEEATEEVSEPGGEEEKPETDGSEVGYKSEPHNFPHYDDHGLVDIYLWPRAGLSHEEWVAEMDALSDAQLETRHPLHSKIFYFPIRYDASWASYPDRVRVVATYPEGETRELIVSWVGDGWVVPPFTDFPGAELPLTTPFASPRYPGTAVQLGRNCPPVEQLWEITKVVEDTCTHAAVETAFRLAWSGTKAQRMAAVRDGHTLGVVFDALDNMPNPLFAYHSSEEGRARVTLVFDGIREDEDMEWWGRWAGGSVIGFYYQSSYPTKVMTDAEKEALREHYEWLAVEYPETDLDMSKFDGEVEFAAQPTVRHGLAVRAADGTWRMAYSTFCGVAGVAHYQSGGASPMTVYCPPDPTPTFNEDTLGWPPNSIQNLDREEGWVIPAATPPS